MSFKVTKNNNSGNNNSGSQQEKKTFEAIPAGTYNAEVARILVKPIDLTKTPWLEDKVNRGLEAQIGFAFKITDGPHAKRWVWNDVDAEISDWEGCKLRLYLQEILATNELPEGFDFSEDDFPDYIGLPCRIRVKQYTSEKTGEVKNGIEHVLAAIAPRPVVAGEEPFIRDAGEWMPGAPGEWGVYPQ